jgi:hypothetical protein
MDVGRLGLEGFEEEAVGFDTLVYVAHQMGPVGFEPCW